MSVQESPDSTTTSGGSVSPPPLDVEAVQRARQHIEDAGRPFWTADLIRLLAAYDNLAARYAYVVASLSDIEREVSGVVKQDPHSDRLLLSEIADLHRCLPSGVTCRECGKAFPCQTRRLIEGRS